MSIEHDHENHHIDLAERVRLARIDDALNSCENEPIHRPGLIQPQGVLLALDNDFFTICHASENLSRIFPVRAEDALDRPFSSLVGNAQADSIRLLTGLGEWRTSAITSFSLFRNHQELVFDAQVSRVGQTWLVEIDDIPNSGDDLFHTLFIPSRDAIWQLDAETDLRRYAQQVVDQVRLLSGYDRVMMYRFDQNWDGEVSAENRAAHTTSYLGNRFPASDIPPQARELYTRNLVRLIADVESVPIKVLPLNHPISSIPLDMTNSALRHLSPVHLQYLRNMGVLASMSISLLQNGRLWGLIACHHETPKHVPLRVRELYEFIGKMVSLKLSTLENANRTIFQERLASLLNRLTTQVRHSTDLAATITELQDEFLGLVRAGGAVVALRGAIHRFGQTPDGDALTELEVWLRSDKSVCGLFETANLPSLFPAAVAYRDIASGMLAVPLDRRFNDYILWFRPGMTHTFKWAGNPEKRIIEENGQVGISPRKSFETWLETRKAISTAWLAEEVDAAHGLSLALIEVINHYALESSEQQYRLLAENSTDVIAQLGIDCKLYFVSAAFESMTGIAPATVVGRYLDDYIQIDDQQKFRETVQSLSDDDPSKSVMVRLNIVDAGELWMECSLRRIINTVSGELEIIMNARDVTQRYTYQLAIEDLHRRHTMVLEVANEGVISLDNDRHIVYANEKAGVILGYTVGDMLGHDCTKLTGVSCGAEPHETSAGRR